MKWERNKNVVTCPYDGVRYYLFVHGTTAETGKQLAVECQSILRGVFEAVTDIVVPTEISLGLRGMSATEVPYGMIEARDKSGGEVFYRSITDSSGITAEDIVAEIENTQCADTEIVYVEQLRIIDCSVRIFLKQGWEHIGSEDDLYRLYKKGEVLENRSDNPPLDLKIRYESSRAVRVPEDREFPLYYVHFTLGSAIWIQETEIGRINHAYLGTVFRQICQNIDIINKYTRSTLGVPASGRLADQLLAYDGPSVDTLVEEYRRGWVDDHLRKQAQSYETDDGTRGVDFGTVTEQIQLEELKARLETYIAADDSTDMIDEARVNIEGDTELRCRLADGEIFWEQHS